MTASIAAVQFPNVDPTATSTALNAELNDITTQLTALRQELLCCAFSDRRISELGDDATSLNARKVLPQLTALEQWSGPTQ
jgi:hypothetical protein